jgi:geranylgeranyl diphosphate synthase type I
MLNYLKDSRELLLRFFDSFFLGLDADYRKINRWGPDVLARMNSFVTGGKMVRGSLVRLTHDMSEGTHGDEAIAAGAAMELFQAAFLIHDDIMDRDVTRRGKPSVHAQYAEVAENEAVDDSLHIGEALGICAGDVALFLAFEILGTLNVNGEIKGKLLYNFCRELEYVGLAQMADVYHGAGRDAVSRENILALYRYKTGRYTFSLPFTAGLILAGRDDAVIEQFTLLGEKLGIIFQIKDDELGLWAHEEELGKPVGSDISENKKTLYREILFERARDDDKKRLLKIFGNKKIGPGDIGYIRSLLESSGTRNEVENLTNRFSEEVRTIIRSLPATQPLWKDRLLELLDYNRQRTK